MPWAHANQPGAPQVLSRLGVFWGVLWMLPQTRTTEVELFRVPGLPPISLGIASMYFCWSVSVVLGSKGPGSSHSLTFGRTTSRRFSHPPVLCR